MTDDPWKPTVEVVEYWLEHYLNVVVGLCGLCGNTGLIDTRGRAVSPAGVDAGGIHYCVCPNGQTRRHVAALNS